MGVPLNMKKLRKKMFTSFCEVSSCRVYCYTRYFSSVPMMGSMLASSAWILSVIGLDKSKLKIPIMDFASMTYLPDTKSKSKSNLLISFTNDFTLSIEFKEMSTVFIGITSFICFISYILRWEGIKVKVKNVRNKKKEWKGQASRMKVALHNLGCKVNAYETEAMQEMLERSGYEIVPFKEGADVYIINTCTVTNMADRKSRQMLHRAKKMNPNAIVVAAGCYVQAKEETGEVDECIDIVIGNNKKKELIEILEEYVNTHSGVKKAVIDINHTDEYEEMHLSRTAEHTRAYLKVQDGCNQFCTYCIIPFARGRVRSRRKEDVLREVSKLAANGYQEVVLTGIHLSSYGVDLEGENLLSLILAVHEVEGIRRIRLGSLEPGIITEEFVKTISNLPKICPHFHLSLQSGCDETLRRMNRRYRSEEYFEKCKLLRKYFDNPALTTDVIVGFPGETEEEFAASKAFIERVGFYETHIFKYSMRKGTKAAVMEGQVSEQVKTERSNVLLALDRKNRETYEASFYGRTVEVLMEESTVADGETVQTGHTKEYVKVLVVSGQNLQNQLVKVRLTGERLPVQGSDFLIGEIES